MLQITIVLSSSETVKSVHTGDNMVGSLRGFTQVQHFDVIKVTTACCASSSGLLFLLLCVYKLIANQL